MALANNFSNSLFSRSGFSTSLSTPALALAFDSLLLCCLPCCIAVTTISLISINYATAFAALVTTTLVLLIANSKFSLHLYSYKL
jgi:hypothetical protein